MHYISNWRIFFSKIVKKTKSQQQPSNIVFNVFYNNIIENNYLNYVQEQKQQ